MAIDKLLQKLGVTTVKWDMDTKYKIRNYINFL